MGKKNDLPAMPFYFGDWRKAPEIRALDLDVRMIWFEMIGLMWESTERGYLTLNGKSVSHSVISRMIGVDIATFEKAIIQMEEYNVFSRRNDGAIFCRKMIRDEEIRTNKSKAGKLGMEKRYNSDITHDITEVVTPPEYENENSFFNGVNNEVVNNTKQEKEKKKKEKKVFVPPTLDEVKKYFRENGFKESVAERAFRGYSENNWHDVNDKPIRNWKSKVNNSWFQDYNKEVDSIFELDVNGKVKTDAFGQPIRKRQP